MNAPAELSAEALAIRQRELVQALSAILPGHGLLHRAEDTTPYECDGLAAYRTVPLAVALPETELQVQRILQVCHKLGVPVVPRGAGTGLSGGVAARPGAVAGAL
jgi:glycolate oxidase